MLTLVRASFRTLERVAPGLAGRWALRIWCTPPHVRRDRHPKVARGERFLVPFTARGTVVAEAWGTGPATTYLLHGWGGRRGHLAEFVAPLVAAGQRVVALDAPGHGESGAGALGGRRTTLPEIAETLAAVIAVAGPAHAIIAHSGGGTAVALAIHDRLISAGRLVFVAPMDSPMPYIRLFADRVGLGPRGLGEFVRGIERLGERGMADYDTAARAATAEPGTLPPLLVIHDRADREVRYADGQAIAEGWGSASPGTHLPTTGATLHTTQGLGHRRLLADPAVIEAAVSFVTTSIHELTGATAAGSTPRS